MTTKFDEFEMASFLEECGWEAQKSGSWHHPTLHWPWPLHDAFCLQRAATRGARGLLFRDLRSWQERRKQASAAS